MKLLKIEVEKRLPVRLDKSIRSDGNELGSMTFGDNNDYPQLIERLINGSATAKAASNIYAKFLTGMGFVNKDINNISVGKDEKGKDIKLLRILRETCKSISNNNGAYIHCNIKRDIKIKNTKTIPFKFCRFQKIDDTGYTSKIGVYENWDKDADISTRKKFNKNDIVWINVFNLDKRVVIDQVNNVKGLSKYKGQINFLFMDNDYLYPLSPIDQVYLDCDTEQQIQVYKNRTIRDGFFDKVVFRVQPPDDKIEKEEFINKIKSFIGPDGDTVLVLEDEIDEETKDVKQVGAFKIDKIEANINDKLFENWERSISNNIRKAYKALPALLIDYEEGKLSTTSGESIIQATNYYNQITKDDRASISEFFKEIYSKFDNEILANNTNWDIEPLNLYDNGTTTELLPATSD